jgi:hypothetical protein
MGIYLSGNIIIGTSSVAVNSFLLRYCNVNSVWVENSNCLNVIINQNYIRDNSDCKGSAVTFTNNILHSIHNVIGGIIDHNVIRNGFFISWYPYSISAVDNSQIKNNIIFVTLHSGNACLISNNMINGIEVWGDNDVINVDLNDVCVGPDNEVNPTSNFALKPGMPGKNAATDGSDIGIYGGSGFSDSALPPVPRIVTKSVAGQTDEDGKLKVVVRVKAQ